MSTCCKIPPEFNTQLVLARSIMKKWCFAAVRVVVCIFKQAPKCNWSVSGKHFHWWVHVLEVYSCHINSPLLFMSCCSLWKPQAAGCYIIFCKYFNMFMTKYQSKLTLEENTSLSCWRAVSTTLQMSSTQQEKEGGKHKHRNFSCEFIKTLQFENCVLMLDLITT